MKRMRYLGLAALLAGPMIVVQSSATVHAAGGSLISAGSVRLSSLVGVTGSSAIGDPEIHEGEEGDEGDGGEHHQPGPAPRVDASDVAGPGAELNLTFEGLNHFDNRTANNGNQFSNEPPDQALCVGPDSVLEGVNTVLRVYDKAGNPISNTISYNEFFQYPPSINRDTGVFGAFLTDPICHYDPDSGRFYMAVLTLDQDPGNGQFTGKNRLDFAVSQTSDPTGDWNLYKLPVQNDGTEGTPNHHCDPEATPPAGVTNANACIGDFPHIGMDNHAVFLTTNEYAFFGDGSQGGFAYTGSQIYAFSKSDLVAGDDSPTMVSFESPVLGPFRSFTVWPAISPAGMASNEAGGTEYFLSSTLGDGSETGNHAAVENRIGVWAVTNTSSIDSGNPALRLSNKLIKADKYSLPPKATQPDGPTPLRDCLNDRSALFGTDPDIGPLGCWALFLDAPPAREEVLSPLDSSDTRMNQVIFANGRLYGAIGTGVRVDRDVRAGVLWVNVEPELRDGMLKKAKTEDSGYVAIAGNDIIYPALGVSPTGRVVMAATVSGNDHYPSASYTVISGHEGDEGDDHGHGHGDDGDHGNRGHERDNAPTVHIISEGVGPQDGFTGYASLVGDPPRPRWGDYGAVAMDGDTMWLASETIEQSCTLDEYLDLANFPDTVGRCNNTRTALANWSTRVSALQV